MPCGRFGANAAWLRLALLTHNVLTGPKRIALKPEWLEARPKRLRFHFFVSPGKLIHHSRRLVARVGRQLTEPSPTISHPRPRLRTRLTGPERLLPLPKPRKSSLPHSLRTDYGLVFTWLPMAVCHIRS
jgi:hypothetical protein